MSRESVLQAVFAGAAVVAMASLASVLLWRFPQRLGVALAALDATAAAAGWVFFALDPRLGLGVAAAGLCLCSLAELGAVVLAATLERRRDLDGRLAAAEARLAEFAAAETERRTAELAVAVSRARADADSMLADHERRVEAERKRLVDDQERRLRSELLNGLTTVRQGVEQRLATWSSDLAQLQQTLKKEEARLAERQRQLIAELEARLEADARRLESAGDDQRALLSRWRTELAEVANAAALAAKAEIDEHAAERRRALHEVTERLRRRERALIEQIEREEAEASQRVRAGSEDVERRQLEKVTRMIERVGERHVEAAEQQFSAAIKSAREEAGRRFARELERAAAHFLRNAESTVSDQLSQVADAGAQRLEQRLDEIRTRLDQQRDELLDGLDRRLSDVEADLRRRLEALETDTDAERGVLEARLYELARRIDEAAAAAEARLGGTVTSR